MESDVCKGWWADELIETTRTGLTKHYLSVLARFVFNTSLVHCFLMVTCCVCVSRIINLSTSANIAASKSLANVDASEHAQWGCIQDEVFINTINKRLLIHVCAAN